MTEVEWLLATDTDPMIGHLRNGCSPRKLRLYGCECAREYYDELTDRRCHEAILIAELFADGFTTSDELNQAREAAVEVRNRIDKWATQAAANAAAPDDFLWIWQVAKESGVTTAQRANRLRCIFGNPFRPAALDPSWLTETVVALATGIYQERAFDRMPILADALEDAGCDNADILNHCRQPGEHVRGCWVVDLLTGRK
jgi:hypothetical protein